MTSRDYAIKHFGAWQQPNGSYVNKWGTNSWYNEEGQVHKEDGPALTYISTNVSWWVNNKRYNFNDWCNHLNISDEQKLLLRLQYE
jgi:hypothetical protein